MSKHVDEAVALLRDPDLVWSSDMEDIKLELAALLEVSSKLEMSKFVAEGLAKNLIYSGEVAYNRNLETR